MKTAELRQAYLNFFEGHGHKIVPSSTLVPNNDPTLLFTNAGMVQFKDPLLGRSDPGYKRATSSQRCVRAGGKHNDLENVGYTARHHTFFEMLGNFSFGDYFKEETITWAWDFVSGVLSLPMEKIWVTVHPSDDEARKLWESKIGMPKERVIDLEENFWTMGDTGPCGPCTELFFDHGSDVSGGPPGSPDEDGDRFVEFWNLVFPQFDRSEDGSLTSLASPGVDTGMGLERMAAIMQGVHSNYEIDLFRPILMQAGQFAGVTDEQAVLSSPSLRVIADHIRSSAFLIADGIVPGNEDRAYVLRRIIRRGLRHGHKMNIDGLFLHKLVDVLVAEMGEAFPILVERQSHIIQVIEAEEIRFSETLRQGMELLQGHVGGLQDNTIPGDVVFQLYDTYGFPADLTADVAREKGLQVDMVGFEEAMEAQRARGRAATSFTASLGQKISSPVAVEFLGYDAHAGAGTVLAVFDETGEEQAQLHAGDRGVVLLDQTPFYAESGGQVGDSGVLVAPGLQFQVEDTLTSGDQHMHIGAVTEGSITAQQQLNAQVDESRRQAIRANHSATHLMHAALRQVLGTHVQQKGSLVAPEKLRFDFSHEQPMSEQQLQVIEDLVNQQIRKNTSVSTALLPYEDALASGAMALFGEKYADQVRMLNMGDGFSVELCGGTHVARTGDIGLFKVISEVGIAAGIRRIEAVSGEGAGILVRNQTDALNRAAKLLKSTPEKLEERISALLDENRQLNKSLHDSQQKLSASQGADLAGQAIDIFSTKFLAVEVEGDNKAMLQTLDSLRSQLGESVIVLANISNGKVGLVVGVSKGLVKTVSAPAVMAVVGPHVGAKGGGRPDLARAGGGDNPGGLTNAFSAAQECVSDLLAARS